MKLTNLFLCLVVCFMFLNVQAQVKDSYEKGTILTKDNEEIDGYIKLNSLTNSAHELCFKRLEEEAKCVSYDTSQIKSYRTESDKSVKLLTIQINNCKTEVSVFANLLLKGEASLYKTMYKSTLFYIVVARDKNYVLQNDELISGEMDMRRFEYKKALNNATEGFLEQYKSSVDFKEKELVQFIADYNASKGVESVKILSTEKNIHFPIVYVGGRYKKNADEFFFQANYRTYYPKFSRSTSLNVGLNYYNYTYYKSSSKRKKVEFNESIISTPLQIQQNILNKRIRPYVFGGLSLCYFQVLDAEKESLINQGLQKSYGIALLYGGGIEVDVYKNIMMKSEFRYELFNHLILFGIGYNFKK